MLKSLDSITSLKNGYNSIMRHEKWLRYLTLTAETHVNMERIKSLEELRNNYILGYVERSLLVLNGLVMPEWEKSILEEVLQWAEVAKGVCRTNVNTGWGTATISLYITLGSAQIYASETS